MYNWIRAIWWKVTRFIFLKYPFDIKADVLQGKFSHSKLLYSYHTIQIFKWMQFNSKYNLYTYCVTSINFDESYSFLKLFDVKANFQADAI